MSGFSGSGNVTGPASSTDNAAVRMDGTSGKVVQNSAFTIADTTGEPTFPGSAWTSYSPTVSSSSGTITTVGTVHAYYKQHGKAVFVRLSITITTLGTGAGRLKVTMPVTPTSGTGGAGEAFGFNAATLVGLSGVVGFDAFDTASIVTAAAAFPITADGQTVHAMVTYEAT